MRSSKYIVEFIHWILKELRFHFYYKPFFHRVLVLQYPFYKSLSEIRKKKFLRLVGDHYDYFEFVPRENFKLTRAVKAVISAGAAHLAYNLPEESLTYYERILVYPDNYRSQITKRLHRGEVNPGLRLIVFSWKGVVEGLSRDEGINLLLHEFAHALWLENKLQADHYAIFDSFAIQQFEGLAYAEMKKMVNEENHFFRRYAFENIEEFFAVAVENFFERPQQFKEVMPHFYEVCTDLFKQDPIAMN